MVYIPSELRDEVLKRSDYQCEYCRTPERYSGIPLKLTTSFHNLLVA